MLTKSMMHKRSYFRCKQSKKIDLLRQNVKYDFRNIKHNEQSIDLHKFYFSHHIFFQRKIVSILPIKAFKLKFILYIMFFLIFINI